MKISSEQDKVAAATLTRAWVETMVVGLNLCPFAAPVVKQDSLRYSVTDAATDEVVAAGFLDELDLIQRSDEKSVATTLYIFPNATADFYDYLDLLHTCERLLDQAGMSEQFQVASFHPGYLFAGVDQDDLSHWTNRSPFPMLHIIRENQMSRVLAHYKDPDAIPERNIALMHELGKAGLIERFPPLADYWDTHAR